MTDVQPIPAGWYPDNASTTPGATRWWDGTQWTEHVQAPAEAAPAQAVPAYAAPSYQAPAYQAPAYQTTGAYQGANAVSAPAGTSPVTWQIWAIVGLFALQMIAAMFYLATFDLNGYLQSTMSSAMGTDPAASLEVYTYLFTPGYIAMMALSFIAYVGTIVLAFLDSKALLARGVPRPFPWALSFVPSYGSMIYVIGRSVIARRRTGSGMAPMWVYLGLFAVTLVVSIIWGFAAFSEIMSSLSVYN